MRIIDHLVICVTDLYEAIDEFSEKCGVPVVYGGQHLSIGTHNALLNIGNGAYLELLAKDPTNPVDAPGWMGIDLISKPTFTRWAIKSDNLERDAAILKEVNPAMGYIFEGSRQKTDGSMLKWGMALPLAEPLIEVLPFILDWKDSVHPTMDLATGCELIGLTISHPEPELVQSVFNQLGISIIVEKNPFAQLKAKIKTPRGIVDM